MHRAIEYIIYALINCHTYSTQNKKLINKWALKLNFNLFVSLLGGIGKWGHLILFYRCVSFHIGNNAPLI